MIETLLSSPLNGDPDEPSYPECRIRVARADLINAVTGQGWPNNARLLRTAQPTRRSSTDASVARPALPVSSSSSSTTRTTLLALNTAPRHRRRNGPIPPSACQTPRRRGWTWLRSAAGILSCRRLVKPPESVESTCAITALLCRLRLVGQPVNYAIAEY